MFFFLIVGTKEVVRGRAEVPPEARFCPRCGVRRAFHGAARRSYLTLFFLPLIPLSGDRPCLACEVCGTTVPPGPHWTRDVRLEG